MDSIDPYSFYAVRVNLFSNSEIQGPMHYVSLAVLDFFVTPYYK